MKTLAEYVEPSDVLAELRAGDVQYVIHPGKTSATRNALVPGLRLAVSP